MAVVNNYTALLRRLGLSWTGGPIGQAVFLTYSFSDGANSYASQAAAASFQPLNEAEKATVRAALAQWSAVAEVTFQEARGVKGDLTFGFYDLGLLPVRNVIGQAYYPVPGLSIDSTGRPRVTPGATGVGGDVEFDVSFRRNPSFASSFTFLALHEIGHALGLKHPFDANGDTLSRALDTTSSTVMSYTGAFTPVLGPLDKSALQHLYGQRGLARPYGILWDEAAQGLSAYGTSAAQTMRGTAGADVIRSGGGRDAIAAGDGNDVIFAAGTAIEVDGGAGWDTVLTGLTYSSSTFISGAGMTRSIFLPSVSDSQFFWNVETLGFTNGDFLVQSDLFAYRDQPGSQTFASTNGRDVLVLDEGRRGDTFVLSGSDVTFTHNGQTDTLRGLAEVRFIDGRLVFNSTDPAAAITRLYKASLGRLPDQAGLNYWISDVQRGASLTQLAGGFLVSPEYNSRFGTGLSNTGFVTQIYRNVLNREPDPAGLAYWRGNLDSGRTGQSATLAAISESIENRTNTASLVAAGIWDRNETAAQVARLYSAGLNRMADEAGLGGWLRDIAGGATLMDVAGNIVQSKEFRAVFGSLGNRHFVETLYANTLKRVGDAAGLDAWTNMLDQGGTRAAVLAGFSESAEHQIRTAPDIMPDDPRAYGIKLA